jgi:murein DD-endopeptidase MepM/ murein hydrolase activator NlpD
VVPGRETGESRRHCNAACARSGALADLPMDVRMARFHRATLLPLALGVALSMPPAAAAAANGGATPGSSSAPVSAGTAAAAGGAAPGATPATAPTSSTRTGGAVPGRKPAHRRTVHHRAKPKPKAKHHRRSPKPTPTGPTVSGVFPVAGPFTFGGPDARFGAQRNGHVHQGQDMVAAEGTPLRAPVSGTVLWTGNQPAGAGTYLVIHGTDGRDYVLMHLRPHTLAVATGEAVRAGEQVGEVGHTGDASGPHLHFEIWIGGWGTQTGQPIDPLPQLRRWAGLPGG